MATFHSALVKYEKARLAAHARIDEAHDGATAGIDAALDNFLATPSPSLKAFGEKLLVLEQEYGLDAQPRHLRALYADVRSLA